MTPAERLERLERGEDPALVLRMASGFAVMAENQFLPGYCLLLAYPQAGQLNDLAGEARLRYLSDMAALGDAVKAATGCLRVNYGIYGNLDPFLHTHVVPRYDWEEAPHRYVPPLSYPAEIRTAEATAFDPERHAELLARIRAELGRARSIL